jgi:glucosylceramidase
MLAKISALALTLTACSLCQGALSDSFTLSQWQSSIPEGSSKETEFAAWGGYFQYNLEQDTAYTLWRTFPDLQSSPEAPAKPARLVIDPDIRLQTVWGLGASMTDSSAWVLLQLKTENPDLYAYTMERLFSPQTGAGFSVIRLAIGSSDYVTGSTYYTYCDTESPDLSAFSIDRDRAHILPVLRDALALNPNIKFLAAPWSAPAWMKTNNSLFGISTAQKNAGQTNRLKPEHYGTYARYLLKFVQAYAAEGITIHGLSLQNEPQFDGAAYPCMRMTVEDIRAVVMELGPLLDQFAPRTRITVHDHNWILHPNDTQVIGGDVKLDPISLVTQLFEDPEIAPYLGGSAWHCYAGNRDDLERVYTTLKTQFPDKWILTTEATAWGSNRANWANGQDIGEINWIYDLSWGLSHNWLATFLHGGTASLQWNFALDHAYGPSPRSDSYAYGLVTVHTASWNEVKFEREFYAMAQISKAMAGGGEVIHSELVNDAGSHIWYQAIVVRRHDGKIGVFYFNQDAHYAIDLTIEVGTERTSVHIEPSTFATFVLESESRFDDLYRAQSTDYNPSIQRAENVSNFRYTYEHDSIIDTVRTRFLFSDDLENWTEVATSESGSPPVNTDEVTHGNWIHHVGGQEGDRHRTVIVQDPTSIENSGKRFYKIELSP